MPIYVWNCKDCEHENEKLIMPRHDTKDMREAMAPDKCEKCGSDKLVFNKCPGTGKPRFNCKVSSNSGGF